MGKLTLSWGGLNVGRTFKVQHDFLSKWFLSTEGFYFKYRSDRNDPNIIRATLYRIKDDSQVDDVRVSEGYGQPHKSHHDIINYFEAKLQLKHYGV